MDDRVIEGVTVVLNCSWEEAVKFLNDRTGAYVYVGGEQHWLSGELIYEIATASLACV